MLFFLFRPRTPRGPMSAKSKPQFQKNNHFLTRPFCPGKMGRLKGRHCRDPSPWWHVARFPYPDSLRERHTALANITSGQPTYPIWICLSGSLTKVSKSYYVIPTACHGLHSIACRAKGQEWWQVTSHDLWQPRCLPRSLSATCRVMMALPPPRGIMTSQKVSLPLKRETELLILYIWTFTQRGR